MFEIDITIIGAGINGLLIAKALTETYPHLSIAIYEQEDYCGHHTSSRNSSVIHAGLYYAHGSLKHLLCREGNRAWDLLASSLDVPLNRCGKFIVASSQEELTRLPGLMEKAHVNGAAVRKATTAELKSLSAYVKVLDAFFSADTAIIETSTLLKKLEDYLYCKGVPVLLKNRIEHIQYQRHERSYTLKTNRDEESIRTKILINAGGIFAPLIRTHLGFNDVLPLLVKGRYLKGQQDFYKKHLIYPVPPIDEKILGVHSTFDFKEACVLDLMLQRKYSPTENLNYSVKEEVRDQMWPAIKERFHTIQYHNLTPDYSGIRPRIIYQGKKYSDFWIQDHAGYIELLGIESPGLTAAPAIANYVLKLVKAHG